MEKRRATDPGQRNRVLLRWFAAVWMVLFVDLPGAALGDSLTAELSYPTAGSTITDPTQPFRWTAVASAQSYLLVVGTAAGQSDVWISGDVSETSVLVPRALPKGPLLYARVWTKVQGILRHSSDAPFTVVEPTMKAPERPKIASGPHFTPISRPAISTTPDPVPTPTPTPIPPTSSAATMIYPGPGDPDVNFERPFAWTTVIGAQSYELLVGTSPGLGDIFDSVESLRTSVLLPPLPARTYYGRIATNVAGQRTFNDFVFGSSGSPAATIRSPLNGSTLNPGQNVFSWDAVPNADAYRI
ncbi:MAG: hypothetical protein ACM369_09895, partial [Acidobacteriota bacterium]